MGGFWALFGRMLAVGGGSSTAGPYRCARAHVFLPAGEGGACSAFVPGAASASAAFVPCGEEGVFR